MAIRGAKLTFVGGKIFLGVQKVQVEQQAFKKKQKKVANFLLLFFLKTGKKLYFVGASVLNHSTLEFRDFSKRVPGNFGYVGSMYFLTLIPNHPT